MSELKFRPPKEAATSRHTPKRPPQKAAATQAKRKTTPRTDLKVGHYNMSVLLHFLKSAG
jgi:hypothetical protein